MLPPETRVGLVHLIVRELERSLHFYEGVIGLALLNRSAGSADLGVEGHRILRITERPGARAVRGTTGLYHFAILVPNRTALARSVRRALETGVPLQGFADHRVSEAMYLPDPDGNGIEIYRDRPRKRWFDARGELVMVTDPLDLQNLMGALPDDDRAWRGLPEGTVLGHVHLHVAAIAPAERFYCDLLGFQLMTRYGRAASFVSAGGYHHHVAFNTWAGEGAPPPPEDAVGLRYFTVVLPSLSAIDAAVAAAIANGQEPEEGEAGPKLRDPSGNALVLST